MSIVLMRIPKTSFMDLYTKVDEGVKVPMGLEEVSEENESEIPF